MKKTVHTMPDGSFGFYGFYHQLIDWFAMGATILVFGLISIFAVGYVSLAVKCLIKIAVWGYTWNPL